MMLTAGQKRWRIVFSLLIGAVLGAAFACQPEPPVNVRVKTTFLPTNTPVICAASTSNTTLNVWASSPTTVQIELTGLVPGEKLTLVASAEIPGDHATRIEAKPEQAVDPKGHFSYELSGLRPLPGSTTNQWQIQVVHKNGIACAELTLP